MARRRKTEVKASEKSSHKYVPVRKSSRQIAKKQLEEKKINGYITQTSCSINSEDSTSEGHSHVLTKKNQNSQKKHNKHKGTTSSDSVNNENATGYKRDAGESDSQDGIDNMIKNSEKLSPENVQQVVSNPSPSSEPLPASASTKAETWSEDVIEEMIICEEMQVEEDTGDNSYSMVQEDVIVEEVLLVNESNLENKNFVEYTVIQNENNTESMAMTSKSETISNNEYHAIRKDINNVHMNKTENSISAMHTSESVTSCSSGNSKTTDLNTDKFYNKKKIELEDGSSKKQKNKTIYDKIRKEISESISEKVRLCSIKDDSGSSTEEDNCKQENKDLQIKNMHVDSSNEDSFNKIDNKLADMQISESSQEIQKLVNDLSSVESTDSPVQTPLNMEKLSPIQLNIDDESSSSILDKMEQLHRSNNSVSSNIKDVFPKTEELNNIIKNQDQNILESNSCIDKFQCTDRVSLKSKIIQDKKSTSQQKNPEHLTNTDEYHDSEGDNKIDNEDIKLCSSSENSNDTLSSLTNYKGREFDIKNTINNTSDIDKKIEFSGRSGNIDTTASENSSNSSGVRRSSRIRSIGLMKQR